ncbi:hypothetical protein CCM_00115 [Cordyceps militaris CM01]|uniref:Nineteen complex-related protein 2-domain-containing protein n=1 Tax=Cordyceps militaris (strain CM01) TaxID=983644 RepID=G3J788_CORMM|nr:uncharacterized protein CCM_00115 [Cordyceps militaris CM01]EGX95461.1 hypothetical protein CCM_00115 [Cordyceps militaris CM01]
MSSFGSRRKARVIKFDDEDAEAAENSSSEVGGAPTTEFSQPSFRIKSAKKGSRQSGLRKTLTADGIHDDASPGNEDEDGPVVVKAKFGAQKQKRKPKSRLSFGLGGNEEEADIELLDSSIKKSTLGQRVVENNAVKRGIALRGFPTRAPDDEHDRPRYSKEYLEELQSSTPTTPIDSGSIPTDGDEMELDAAELEGALVVDSPAPAPAATKIQVLTEAEIQERKERRARLAQEQDFLSVEDDDDDGRTKKKGDARLATDEDQLGEGFDDFVEDGGISLGKRAEKQRRKQNREKMAELINAAEGHSSDSSSDSEAERRIAYETAQTRSGMDGLKRPRRDPAKELLEIPSKITPLPSLAECIARLQTTLSGMEAQMQLKSASVAQMRSEKQGIATREKEVQALLDETGKKYQEAMGKTAEFSSDGTSATRAIFEGAFAGDRGLDSLGLTPGRTAAEMGDNEL